MCLRLVAAAFTFAFLTVPPSTARAQCFSPASPPYLTNACGTTPCGGADPYEYSVPQEAFLVPPTTLLLALQNDLSIYDATNPLSPGVPKTIHIPWDWNVITGEGTHGGLITHIAGVATIDGFDYALVSLRTYGWDLLKLAGKASVFLKHGYHPVATSTARWLSAALFQSNGTTYAVASALDDASIAAKDWSIRIYPVGGTVDTATLTSATLGAGVRIPVGRPSDAIDDTAFKLSAVDLRVVTMGSGIYLVATSNPDGPTLFADITDPASPKSLVVDSQFAKQPFVVDRNDVLWAAASSQALNGYSIVPTNPPSRSPFVLTHPGITLSLSGPTVHLSTVGPLLVAFDTTKMQYFAVPASPGPVSALPEAGVPFNALDPLKSAYPSSCKCNGFPEMFQHASPFEVGGHVYVARSRSVDSDVIQVNDSCLFQGPGADGGLGADAGVGDGAAGDTDAGASSDAAPATASDAGASATNPGCGCSAAGSPGGLIPAVLLLLVGLRRVRAGHAG